MRLFGQRSAIKRLQWVVSAAKPGTHRQEEDEWSVRINISSRASVSSEKYLKIVCTAADPKAQIKNEKRDQVDNDSTNSKRETPSTLTPSTRQLHTPHIKAEII